MKKHWIRNHRDFYTACGKFVREYPVSANSTTLHNKVTCKVCLKVMKKHEKIK